MKKGFKKLFSCFLAFIMIFGAIPLSTITELDLFATKAGAASYSVGDIILYGTYPQSEVTEATLKAKIAAQTPDRYGDVWVEGVKYRRKTYGVNTKFFRFDPIEWRVLSIGSDMVYVMAEKILEHQPYNTSKAEVTWETCTLRKYLNDNFYNSAFSSAEKRNINYTVNVNDGYSYTSGGNDTWDYVFIPSRSDVLTPAYGFTSSTGISETRSAISSPYVEFSCVNKSWWLRTPGTSFNRVFSVLPNGSFPRSSIYGDVGTYVNETNVGVRPALILNPESAILKSEAQYTIQVTSSTTGQALSGASVNVAGTIYTTSSSGIATFTLKSLLSNQNIIVSKSGYTSKTILVSQIMDGSATVALSPASAEDPLDVVSKIDCVDLGSATAKGPTINVLGKELTLFSADLGLKLDVGSFNFKTKYNEDDKTYKVIIGVKDGVSVEDSSQDPFLENYEDFRDFFNLTNQRKTYLARQKYQKIQNKLDKKSGMVGVSGDIGVAGFMNFDVSSGEARLIESGVTVTVEAEYSAEFPFWYVFYATYTIGGEAEASFSMQYSNSGGFACSGSFGLAFKPSAGVGVKALSKKIATCEVGLKGELGAKVTLPASSLVEGLNAYLNVNAYIKATLFALSYSKSTDWDGYTIFPRSSSKTISEASVFGPDLTITADDFTLIDRSYLDERMVTEAAIDTTGIDFYKDAVYPFGAPKIVALDNGCMLALWVDDDGTKSNANLTSLYYSFFDGVSWSVAMPVYESGYAEFAADIVTDGQYTYAIWQRATKAFTDDVTADDYAQNTELVYSSFDGDSWSEPIVVTNNMAIDYAIDVTDGVVTVVWTENTENDYLCEIGTCSVKKSILTDGTFTEILVASELPTIESLALGSVDGVVKVLYCMDEDIYQDGIQLTSTANNCAVSYQNGSFWWISAGKTVSYNGTLQEYNIYASSDYKVISNGNKTAFLSTVTDGFSNELYVAFLEDGAFGELKQFTNYGGHISDYDAIMYEDGTIILAADIDNMNTDEGSGSPFTTTDFVVEGVHGTYNLSIDKTPVISGDIIEGNTISFEFDVTNKGSNTVDSFTLKLTDDNGNVLLTKNVDAQLMPGEIVSSYIDFTLPSEITRTEYNIVVEHSNDTDISDNTSTYHLGFADLVFENVSISDSGVVTATLKNIGYESAEEVSVIFKKFDESYIQLDSLSVGTLSAGESRVITFTAPESEIVFDTINTKHLFTLEAYTTTEELNISDNIEDVALLATAVTGVSLDITEKTVLAGDEFKLTATIMPIDAVNKNIIWTTSSTTVASVDENGVVSAVGAGVATIRATTEDGAFIADCTVTVHKYDTEFTVDVEPTCTEEGSKSKHCIGCDLVSDVTVIDALGHDYSDEWTIDTKATCTQEGSKSYHCTRCSNLSDVTVIDALGHDYSEEWTIDIEATCTEEGSKSHHCTRCSNLSDVTVIDALGHDYSNEWTIDTLATCTQEGSKSHHCIRCDDKVDITIIEMLEHDYVAVSSNSEHPHTTDYECHACGATKSEALKAKNCVYCNYETTAIDSQSLKIISYIGEWSEVDIPKTIDGKTVTVIGNSSFRNATTVEIVTISDSVTSIGALAFMGCTGLNKITIPSSVTSIGAQVFYGCSESLVIYCERNSVAHQYAIDNNIKFLLFDIIQTEETKIDYVNKIIYTSVSACNDIADMVYVPGTSMAIATPSYSYGGVDYLGTGTIITVFENGTYTGDYTVVVIGDTNGDSVCDVLDAAQVAKVSNGHTTLDGAYALAADSNEDDIVDITDYQSIVNKTVA